MPSTPSEIAARYGLALAALPGGVANEAYALGDALVLRVPRSAAYAVDLAREAIVLPAALGAGVLAPSIVEYSGAYMVMTRIPGRDLASSPPGDALWRAVGAELAKLHTVSSVPGLPPPPAAEDPAALVSALASQGWLDRDAAAWLTGWFARLAARVPSSVAPVLVHGDIAPQNLMADPSGGALTGIVDWGDAALDDPAVDFAKLPLWAVVPALAGYLGSSTVDEVTSWCARILRVHLVWGLARLRDPVPSHARHWTAPPAGRVLGLLRFFAESPPDPWPSLT